jgi:uncharacterized protein with FMN-binding domain
VAKRVPRSLVALSSAIAAIYAAGYVRTQAAATSIAAAETAPPGPVVTATAAPTALPRALGTGRSNPGPGAAPTPTVPLTLVSPTTTIQGGLRDGTYQGHGTSRRGDIDVQLTIQGGRITTVQITRATTSYPTSRIAALPGQVVARQSAQVDLVTGATLSARAFQQAVAQALAQAQPA